MVSEEWFIGIYGVGMRDFSSRFGQIGGVEQIAIRCMCFGMQESSLRQEAIGQVACCSQ